MKRTPRTAKADTRPVAWLTAALLALALSAPTHAAPTPPPHSKLQQPMGMKANPVCVADPGIDTSTPADQLFAAGASCASDCESRFNLCLKEANTDAIRDKCKVYFKGCLKSCTQGK